MSQSDSPLPSGSTPSWPDPPTTVAQLQPWLDERMAEFERLIGERFAKLVNRAVTAYAESLTAAADPAAFDGTAAEWRLIIEGPVADFAKGVYLSGNLSAWLTAPATPDPEAWLAVVNEQAILYQQQAVNRIVGLSNDAWQAVQDAAMVNIQTGMSVDELRRQVEDITGFGRRRAEAIARTETMSAYNGGDMAGHRALGEFAPVAKEWLAALDARTREDHAAANGQRVAMDEPFVVGGEPMDRPGDPAGSPGNVINCRCTTVVYFPGDPEAEPFTK